MEEAKLESVRLRMALAEEKLVVARHLLAAGHYNDVIAKGLLCHVLCQQRLSSWL